MRRSTVRAPLVALAVAVVVIQQAGGIVAAAAGDVAWSKAYDGQPTALAVSPDGARLFVTGLSHSASHGWDYLTVAYDASTGAKLWSVRYNGPGDGYDAAWALGVSPDGTLVFVTGQSKSSGNGGDYTTIAYNAATGAKVWLARYDGPASKLDGATALAVSPDGAKVLVTGASKRSSGFDYATVAYRADTGGRLWAKRYNGPGNRLDQANAIAISPDGSHVVVTGFSCRTSTCSPLHSAGFDYATVSYAIEDGAQQWAKRYNGPANDFDIARAAAFRPDGSLVYVTGSSDVAGATLAYDAATGAKVWLQRFTASNDFGEAYALAVSPDGSGVFVTGYAGQDELGGFINATLGYDAATGGDLWQQDYGAGIGRAVAVSGDSDSLYVGGDVFAAASTSDGGPQWSKPLAVNGIAISPDDARVYVFNWDSEIVAYNAT
jgi:WD40 repeat protein